jgi:hypothetical protein
MAASRACARAPGQETRCQQSHDGSTLYSSSAQGRGAVATNLPLRHQVHDGMEAEELLQNALRSTRRFRREEPGYTYLS